MPITVDIMQNDFLREAFEKGQQAGEHKGEYRLLAMLLEQRFGPLPEDVVERLQTASLEELERWGMVLLSARTLTDVFR